MLAAFVYVQRQREEHHCLTLPTAYQRKKVRAYEIERFGLATVLERDEEARLRAYPPVACNLPAYDEPRARVAALEDLDQPRPTSEFQYGGGGGIGRSCPAATLQRGCC